MIRKVLDMRILLRDDDWRVVATNADTREFLGEGTSPDEAIGAAVRAAWLSDNRVTITDIAWCECSKKDNDCDD